MQKIAIVYSFNTQKTSKIAKRISDAFGKDARVELVNVEEITSEQFLQYIESLEDPQRNERPGIRYHFRLFRRSAPDIF